MTILALVAAMVGFLSLALSMDKHHQEMRRRKSSSAERRAFRSAGWGGLAISLVLAMAAWGAAVGSILWFGILSFAAALVLLLLSRIASAPRGR